MTADDDSKLERRIRAIRAANRREGYRVARKYWEPLVLGTRQMLNKYYTAYGASQNRVEELEAVVGILTNRADRDELPSAWELVCEHDNSAGRSHP